MDATASALVTIGHSPARDETGSHRFYRADDVYLASVLLRLAGPGIPHNVIKLISENLQEKIRPEGDLHSFWEQAKTNLSDHSLTYYLQVWIPDEGALAESFGGKFSASAMLLEGRDVPLLGDDYPTLTLSLTSTFQSIARGKRLPKLAR